QNILDLFVREQGLCHRISRKSKLPIAEWCSAKDWSPSRAVRSARADYAVNCIRGSSRGPASCFLGKAERVHRNFKRFSCCPYEGEQHLLNLQVLEVRGEVLAGRVE